MDLPEALEKPLKPLFADLPLDVAMFRLVVDQPPSAAVVGMVETLLKARAFAGREELQAGLWLYVDDLDRSHTMCQGVDDETGSYWHGIMHRREPDYSNAKYWFNRVGSHPAYPEILERVTPLVAGTSLENLAATEWDSAAMVDAVSGARSGSDEYGLLQQVHRVEFEVLLERFGA